MEIVPILVFLLTVVIYCTVAHKNPNFQEDRTTIVELFEWKWNDVAIECEQFLGPQGYGGVQVSPANENIIIRLNGSDMRPWWERYQPISYKILSRSGNEEEFADMVHRCNNVGVRIYVDVVLNHMTSNFPDATGTGESTAIPEEYNYPGVPYSRQDFHIPQCSILNNDSVHDLRFCDLNNQHDLNQTSEHVRSMIVNYLNKLIGYGVAGFRIDSAKHMAPLDLLAIYGRLNNLEILHRFTSSDRPYIYQDVYDIDNGPIHKEEYSTMGAVLEYKYGLIVSEFVKNRNTTKLKLIRDQIGFLPPTDTVVFIDDHVTQRKSGATEHVLTYTNNEQYQIATAFMLAYPYGTPKVMSSYFFGEPNYGPPQTTIGEMILSSVINNSTGFCTEWVREHRSPIIYKMVRFRKVVRGTKPVNWWDDGVKKLAFGREGKGFVAISLSGIFKRTVRTGLSEGSYCEMIYGTLENGKCTGKTIKVNQIGVATFEMFKEDNMYVMAIHIEGKLK